MQLRAELAELREQKRCASGGAQEPAGQPTAAVQSRAMMRWELTAYRRAEQTERMARDAAASAALDAQRVREHAEKSFASDGTGH